MALWSPNPGIGLIDRDTPCPRCQYNLRGLKPTDRCPECGDPIRLAMTRRNDAGSLIEAPHRYLRLLAAGCVMLACGAVLAAFTGGAIAGGLLVAGPAAAIVLALGCLSWAAGVWVVTRPRQLANPGKINPAQERRLARWSARMTQSGAVLLGLSLVGVAMGGPGPMLWIGLVGGLVALLGLAPLCLWLADLAWWASAEDTHDRLLVLPWGLIIPTVVIIAVVGAGRLGYSSGLGGSIGLVLSAMALVWFLGVLVASMLQLAHMSVWAIANHAQAAENGRRAAEREHQAMTRPVPAPVSSVGPSGAGQVAPHPPARGFVQHDRPENTQAYDLADDDPSPDDPAGGAGPR